MTFTIEKNIRPPTSGSTKYPFKEMEVGDSFFAPVLNPNQDNAIRTRTYGYGTQSGKKFSVRKVEGGVRVWRVA